MFQTIPSNFLGRLSTIYNRLVIKVQKWFYHIISQADRHFLEYHHFDPSQITTDFKCRNIKESDILMHPRKQLKRKVRSGDSSGKGGSKVQARVAGNLSKILQSQCKAPQLDFKTQHFPSRNQIG